MKRYQDDFKASIVKMHREEKRSINVKIRNNTD
ncbi:transposase [Lactiplantibacillus plantarum]|nr:transposase [Lactiplantibacillus plantarum]MCG0599648.1 transposase [Lactiplantibacillus plantarum]